MDSVKSVRKVKIVESRLSTLVVEADLSTKLRQLQDAHEALALPPATRSELFTPFQPSIDFP